MIEKRKKTYLNLKVEEQGDCEKDKERAKKDRKEQEYKKGQRKKADEKTKKRRKCRTT